ncbi:MAG: DUF2934 domain-containing protein [Roseobacter sp.]
MAQTPLDEAQIRETAYLFWLDDGQPEGRDQEHWLKAIDALTPPTPKKARKAPAKTRTVKAKTAAPKAAKPKAAAAKKPRAKKAAAAQ